MPREHVLRNVAVSTSGNTVQSWRVGDHVYSHIIDPKTGLGYDTNDELIVSVIAPAGLLADPLATAIFLMKSEAGQAYAKRRGVTVFSLIAVHSH
jgi:thiamine biosynthesis lipoprotein